MIELIIATFFLIHFPLFITYGEVLFCCFCKYCLSCYYTDFVSNLLNFCKSDMDPMPEPVSYLCGDCGIENTLKTGDVIQCRDCGYRILYKKRTRRIVQYEAR